MAKKSKKNNSNKPYFLYGLIGVFLALVLSLIVYNLVTESFEYSDNQFNHVEDWLTFRILEMPEDEYILLYNYDEFCAACNQIKQDVLRFANRNNNDITMYLADVRNPSLQENAMFSPAPSETIPHMALLYNGEIIVQRTGTTGILELLRALNEGEYIS